MTSESEIIKHVKLSGQARILIHNLNEDFNLEKFLHWWLKNKLVVGDAHVLEYLMKLKGNVNDDKNK